MYSVFIRDMLGVESADLRLEPGRITCITGPNDSGKTSVITICRALFSRSPRPLGATAAYARRPALMGRARLSADTGTAVEWRVDKSRGGPPPPMQADRGAPLASAASVGMIDFVAAPKKERAALWEDVLFRTLASPAEIIAVRLKAVMPDPADIQALFAEIESAGALAVHRAYSQRAAQAKTAWKKTTKEDWVSARVAKKTLARMGPGETRGKAKSTSEAVVKNERVAEMLAPAYARAAMMETGLLRVRSAMISISGLAGWKTTGLSPDFDLTTDKLQRVPAAASHSERVRLQIVAQIAVARFERAPFLAIDDIDRLDGRNLTSLSRLLHVVAKRPDPPAVLVSGMDIAPRIFAPGGIYHEIEDGVLRATA